ncbi:macro domain-containing protein [Acholeplasma manati]|uniref:Macro domain-containing protein n=1 Tax=Paracholeplasma manati TaxID=591373 RepID=A0ABT2YB21_9MOLU|nr:macro domain-containing protein [Paracholeplasma manati]MCV2231213.1 macro domain-containing protein [Paracholeplasma manati]
MPFEILRNDILTMKVDAIVNSTSSEPFIFGGLDAKIHQQAGPELIQDRRMYGTLKLSEPIITKGYNLLSKYVIHVVGPIYKNGKFNEKQQLKSTYQHVLELAQNKNLESIAFPLISSGVYRYPRKEALEVALEVIKQFSLTSDMMIYLVVYDDASYEVSKPFINKTETDQTLSMNYFAERAMAVKVLRKKPRSIDELIEEIDFTFQEMLFKFIDQKGLNDVDVYKKANVDRKLFSKIKSNRFYQPSKSTALAFSIALELNLDETLDLLKKAGYTLSDAIPLDIIVAYHIEKAIYDIYEINMVLFDKGEHSIGSMN